MKNWRIIKDTVRGASHKRSGQPNQDRIDFFPKEPFQYPILLAAADGHGGKTYFRSGKGAQLAIESAFEICKDLDKITWDEIKDKKIIDWICRDIVQIWRDKVDKDIIFNPFNDEEKNVLSQRKNSFQKRPVDTNYVDGILAYGSTLIVLVIHESYLLFFQIGDGDVLTIDTVGLPDQPIPSDERLLGTETTSLCLPEAWSDFRFRLIPRIEYDQDPALIFISTDGFKNSFKEESGFEQFGIDLFRNLCENPDGIESEINTISENLADWLNHVSEGGVGDDTTMGIVFNIRQIKKYRDNKYKEILQEKSNKTDYALDIDFDQSTPDTSDVHKNDMVTSKETDKNPNTSTDYKNTQ